jgi:hypothetical protein
MSGKQKPDPFRYLRKVDATVPISRVFNKTVLIIWRRDTVLEKKKV